MQRTTCEVFTLILEVVSSEPLESDSALIHKFVDPRSYLRHILAMTR